MDMENGPRGEKQDATAGTHAYESGAPVLQGRPSVPSLGHERQITPPLTSERPSGDAAGGEYSSGGE